MRWPFGPPHLTLKPSKKTKKKTTTDNTQQNPGNPKQQKQKLEHSNLIYQTTTGRSKEENKQNKTNKRKGQHKKQRALKAGATNLKKPAENSAFSNITSEFLKQNPFWRTPKTPMGTISVSVCFLFSV